MIELLWQIFGIVWIVFNSTNLTLLAQCFIVGNYVIFLDLAVPNITNMKQIHKHTQKL